MEDASPTEDKKFYLASLSQCIANQTSSMRRKIVADPICERCKLDVENAEHALWSCLELDVVWANQVPWIFRHEVGFSGMKELLPWMVEKGMPLEQFAFTA